MISPEAIKAIYDLTTKLRLDRDFKGLEGKIMGYADRVLEEQAKRDKEKQV